MSELIMNITPGETRIARLDEGVLSELFIERDNDQQIVGNVYKGIVTRVLPGMQAAFLDIGLEKAAFLYVSDVVPDLFEMDDDEDDASDGDAGDQPANAAPKKDNRRSRHKRGPLPKIEDLIKEGQHLVVQVAKEPIRTKGARVTCHVSFPGRFVVSMPTVDHIGVSRRVGSYEERSRLKNILHKCRNNRGGLIARTISSGASEAAMTADVNNLQRIWADISSKQEKAKPPFLLYQDLSLILRCARDLMSPDIERLIVDSAPDYKDIMSFMQRFMPDLASRVELYNSDIPIFDVHGIETEINRALGKKVWLKSGGYLIIDQAEALTAVDVNTGRFVGRDDFEDTILQTNLEAAEEIAYQLKLRNLGGIIIIDFIDMERHSNRQKVFYTLKNALKLDKVRTTITKISDLGLVEMTRKRTRDSLIQMISETCFLCQGKGHIKAPETVAFEMFRELNRTMKHLTGRLVQVSVHPRVAQVLFNEARARLDDLEKTSGKRIAVNPVESFPVEKFEITTKN